MIQQKHASSALRVGQLRGQLPSDLLQLAWNEGRHLPLSHLLEHILEN